LGKTQSGFKRLRLESDNAKRWNADKLTPNIQQPEKLDTLAASQANVEKLDHCPPLCSREPAPS